MDYSIFKALHRHFIYIQIPSPFASPRVFAAVAKSLWEVVRRPAMNTMWAKDQGLYRRVVKAAQFCEDRSN